jgi:hypothetical protein
MRPLHRLQLLAILGFLAQLLAAAGTRGAHDIRDFGAVPDGVTLSTQAINRAVAAAAADGGGTVLVPPGRFLSGAIYLQSNVTLHLAAGAVLVGSSNLADYPLNPAPVPADTPEFRRLAPIYPARLEYGRYSLINAIGQHHVTVEGRGIIDGSGDSPGFQKANIRAAGLSAEEAHYRRPYGMSFIQCTQVQVREVTLRNLAFWTQGYLDCADVLVDGVTVDSPAEGRNNDGIDIDGSRRVRVVNCNFDTGDDSICLKSSYRECEDIVISNCTCSSRANGVKLGTASNGGFRNITIANLTMNRIACAGLALEVVDGGVLDGVTVSNITMREVGAALFVRLGDRGRRWMAPADHAVGTLRNVSIQNIVASVFTPFDGRPLAASISGLPDHPVENVTVRGLRLTVLRNHRRSETAGLLGTPVPENPQDYPEYSMFGSLPAYGLYLRHVRGVQLEGLDVTFAETDHRPALFAEDVQQLRVAHLRSRVLPDSDPVIVLRDVRDAQLTGLVAAAGTGAYLRVEGASAGIAFQAADLTQAREPVQLAAGVPADAVRR